MKKLIFACIALFGCLILGNNNVYAYRTDGGNTLYVDNSAIDFTSDLNSALRTARDNATAKNPITVKIAPGKYEINGCLTIFSNTILDLTDGVTISYSDNAESKNMILSGTNGKYDGETDYNNSAKCSGYNGFENITIKGGTWIGSEYQNAVLFRFAHAKNVTLDGITISGGAGLHQVEVAAIDGFHVKNCTFKDFSGAYENGKKMEALQLDTPCSSTCFKAFYLDGTILKNVDITNCVFDNVPRGIGTHSMLMGTYHDGIKINNNTFKNIYEEAINCLGYKNCEIKNNKISNCGTGILFQGFNNKGNDLYTTVFDGTVPFSKEISHDMNTVISGNEINISYEVNCNENVAIKVMGVKIDSNITGKDGHAIAAGDYYISGVNVSNNIINTAGNGIRFLDVKDSRISGNTINSAGISPNDVSASEYDGVHLSYESNNISVLGNNINQFPRNGIYLRERSMASSIKDNTISNCKSNGISLYNGCSATEVVGNKISSSNEAGIKASANCSLGKIESNSISGIKNEAGIVVYNASTTGVINNNTIATGKCNAIKISTNSLTGNITSNTIKDSTGKGIFVISGSTITGAISNNNFANVRTSIYLNSIKNDLNINSNSMSGAYSNIIVVDTKNKSKNINITNNSLSGNKTSTGIWIKSGKFSIAGNKISKVNKGITTQSGVTGSIMNNKFKSVKTQMNINGKKNYSFGDKKVAVAKLENIGKGKCVVNWKKYNLANTYEIQYSTKKNFSKNVKTVKAGKNKKCVTIPKLNKKKTYYVRIRAINKLNGVTVYNSYSSAKKLKLSTMKVVKHTDEKESKKNNKNKNKKANKK